MALSSAGPGNKPRQQHENRAGSNTIGENSSSTKPWKDVLAERIVAALVTLHAPAVDPNRRVAEHAVERQPDALAFVLLRQFKRAAIPGDAVRRILHAERVKTMAAIGGPVERQ